MRYTLMFLILLVACTHTKNEKLKVNSESDLGNMEMIDRDSLSIANKNLEINHSDLVLDLSVYNVDSNNISVTSNGKLTNYLFRTKPSLQELQATYNNIFTITKDTIVDSDNVFYAYKLVYKDSFVKIFHNNITDSDDIISARITNDNFKMTDDIHIGMAKHVFFDKMFGDSTFGMQGGKQANIIRNGDEIGDIQQTYIFDANKLKEIQIKSNYDWIDFEL